MSRIQAAPHSGNQYNRQSATPSTLSGRAGENVRAASLGTGAFVSNRASTTVSVSGNDSGLHHLNLINAPAAEATHAVLGQALGARYVVDPRITGTVTLQTSGPVPTSELVDIFEQALTIIGAGVVRRGAAYHVVPLSEALGSNPHVSVPAASLRGPGIRVHVIELQHIAAAEMRTVLEPLSRQGAILRADSTKNYIVVAGTGAELASMMETIRVFDVDWMRGQSIAFHPLKASSPAAIVEELETIFSTRDGPGKGLVKFIPNERLNSILVISSKPHFAKRAAAWIKKLDHAASNTERQLFSYEIQNRPAKELASVLQSALSGKAGSAKQSGVAEGLNPVTVSTDGPSQSGTAAAGSSSEGISVVADTENNNLLIHATAKDKDRITSLVRALDIAPSQVLLEAVIAEVTLNDELKFGLRWFFEKGGFNVSLSDVASGFTGASFPGFAFQYKGPDVSVTLNALSSITDVKVISAPTLMALSNQKAVLQIGDQVPIVTQQSTGTVTANAPVINQIDLKDTGVILTVTPRVNKNGWVSLDIEQEVSNVVKTTTSGIDSPTIQKRKIGTRVSVFDGESLALGGLIQERNSLSRGQIPVLGSIPVLGNAFKNKTDTISRTELIVFIRPRVIRNAREARAVTSEYQNQIRLQSPTQVGQPGESKLRRDLRRIAY